jgi:DNA-binding transcriptional MocR family regulator
MRSMTGTPSTGPELYRYQELAARLARAIDSGALRAGERLPSVRALCTQERLSISTVMQSLARLEFQGYVESRPRSGTFVRARRVLPAPAATQPVSTSRPITMSGLVARIAAANRDPRLVPLSAGVPTAALLPEAPLARALAAAAHGGIASEPPQGFAGLRRAVAHRAVTWGVTVAPDDVLITAGTTEAVFLALRAVTAPGDSVAIESPTYRGGLQTLEALGLRAVQVPCDPSTGMDVDALAAILDRQRLAAVLASPNFSNPVGGLMPDAAKRRLARLLAEREVPLVEDDVFGDLSLDDRRPPPVKAFDREGWVLTCGSFSKTLCPGWRVGHVLPGRFAERVLQLKYALNVSTASAVQRALARFLETGAYDRHLRRLRAALRAGLERTSATITATFPPGTRVSRPAGGCVVWVELPRSVDALALHERALAGGVALEPGHVFGPRGEYAHFIRLAYCHGWDDRVRRAVERVGRLAWELAEAR